MHPFTDHQGVSLMKKLMGSTSKKLLLFFLLIQTPAFVNRLSSVLANTLGYKISVQNLLFSPGLKAEISDLDITRIKDRGLSFHSRHVSFDGKISTPLK